MPLPSILFLAFFALYIPFTLISRRRAQSEPKRTSYASSNQSNNFDAYAYAAPGGAGYDGLPALNWRAEGILPKWARYLYVVLVVCLLGLRILEIARLIAAKMGLGLLPINVVANLLVLFVLLYSSERLGMRLGQRREVTISLVRAICSVCGITRY